jgi:hypothetical protein
MIVVFQTNSDFEIVLYSLKLFKTKATVYGSKDYGSRIDQSF